ncbi:MAG: S9 family peptidase, partial [Gemmatimonadetes bacterium]|nr:S9 family peptidase [Gemmatimonadota bacterium]
NSPVRNDAPPLIRRQVFLGNPDKASPQISPDGAWLGWLAPVEGVLNVWAAPAEKPAEARPVTRDTGRGVRMYSWTYSPSRIVYLQDSDGDENWHIYTVDLDSGEIRDLTPIEGVRAEVQQVSPQHPRHLLVGLNDRDPRFHDIHRIDLVTGERTLVQRNDEFSWFVTDEGFNLRFGVRQTPDGGSEYLRKTGDNEWASLFTIGMEDSMTTWPMGFDRSGRVLYMTDSRARNTAAMKSLDLEAGAETVLAADPRSDAGGVMVHPTEKTIQAVSFNYERKSWKVLDESIAQDLEYLETVAPGEIEVVGRTLDDSCWIVAYLLDDGPVRYYRYLRGRREARFLFTNRAALEGLPLVKMHPAVIPSRDGLDLVCYYSLPRETDPDGSGRPARPAPMVLMVHGGPWGRDAWGYDPGFQLLANRGYAVLSVNFRGSTGFGKEFVNAANHEWAGRMHDDLIDAVNWAVSQGIADPERVAVMGGSYGGYATLVGMTFTPETFACGVDIVGPSNLVTLLESIPPYWEPQVDLFASRVGDHRTEEGREFLQQRSPLTHVDRIRRPLLIGQGANDPRVKQSESDQIVQAMREKEIPVTYVLYPDEGHGFARPENNLSFFAVTEAFLASCLGGRYEPAGEDLDGSSITVPAGAESVPGLPEALDRVADR